MENLNGAGKNGKLSTRWWLENNIRQMFVFFGMFSRMYSTGKHGFYQPKHAKTFEFSSKVNLQNWPICHHTPLYPHSSPEPSPEPCWTWPGSAPKPPGTFSGTLLNLTWLCTKASQTFSVNLIRNLLQPPCWAWPGSALKPFSGTFGTLCGTSLNLTRRLHQCTPELFWAEDPISLRCWGTKVFIITTCKRNHN